MRRALNVVKGSIQTRTAFQEMARNNRLAQFSKTLSQVSLTLRKWGIPQDDHNRILWELFGLEAVALTFEYSKLPRWLEIYLEMGSRWLIISRRSNISPNDQGTILRELLGREALSLALECSDLPLWLEMFLRMGKGTLSE